MRWTSALVEGEALAEALGSGAARCAGALAPDAASLVVAFVSIRHADAFDQVPGILRRQFPAAVILGCSAAGVIGDGREVEDRPAVALTAAHLPGVRLHPFHVAAEAMPSPDGPPGAWERLAGVTAAEQPHFLLLLDPFSLRGEELLAGLDFAFPAARKVGGLASGAMEPGLHALFLDDAVHRAGGVGVALSGDFVMDTVVAQGCRPILEPRRITACGQNLLLELDGEPPLAYLRRMYPSLPPRDQLLVRRNLFLGIAAPGGQYLIRNIVGADGERGILGIGEYLREGQLVQFHVRDAFTSSEDLNRQLTRALAGGEVAGALLFQCNGRGRHLYGREGHDTDTFRQEAGPVPIAGFFCNGEIGPVGGATYLHGYTSSFALFRKTAG